MSTQHTLLNATMQNQKPILMKATNKMKPVKIASSGTVEGLQKLLYQYYYSNIIIDTETLQASNSKGAIACLRIKKSKTRYTAYYEK